MGAAKKVEKKMVKKAVTSTDKKRRVKRRKESFSSYVYKVLDRKSVV